jgi:hypothetical protein
VPQSIPRSMAAEPAVLYLDTDTAVSRFLDSVAGARELALDTEGASFHRFVDRIYLIQLSTRDAHAIIDPLPIRAPSALGALLEDPAVEVVFHDADYDLRLLHQDYGWHVTNMFDTRIAAQLLGVTAFGLAALLERSFGVKLDKKHQRADWSMRPLTPGMLDYAAQDTLHLLGLRDELRHELEPGKSFIASKAHVGNRPGRTTRSSGSRVPVTLDAGSSRSCVSWCGGAMRWHCNSIVPPFVCCRMMCCSISPGALQRRPRVWAR